MFVSALPAGEHETPLFVCSACHACRCIGDQQADHLVAEKSNRVLQDNLEKLWCAEAGEMIEEHVHSGKRFSHRSRGRIYEQ